MIKICCLTSLILYIFSEDWFIEKNKHKICNGHKYIIMESGKLICPRFTEIEPRQLNIVWMYYLIAWRLTQRWQNCTMIIVKHASYLKPTSELNCKLLIFILSEICQQYWKIRHIWCRTPVHWVLSLTFKNYPRVLNFSCGHIQQKIRIWLKHQNLETLLPNEMQCLGRPHIYTLCFIYPILYK